MKNKLITIISRKNRVFNTCIIDDIIYNNRKLLALYKIINTINLSTKKKLRVLF